MSPDTNNNIGNESRDQTESDDDESEDEPAFKYSTITISTGWRKNNENVKNLPAEFSCIAVHEKFLVIGKTTGEILITDHMGNISPQYQIKAHTYPVNAISIDDNGEFIGSCCQEGKVKISGLFTKNDDQLVTFTRPIKAVCLDPNFAKTKMFITGDTSLILNEKGRFGRHKTTTLRELNNGLIHTLRWKEHLIAFANDKGVGVYDLATRQLIGIEETIGQKDLPRGIYPCRISWNDPTTLAIACAKTIKIMMITSELSSDHQSSAPKKHMNTASSFKIEFYACGLTSVNRDLVVLGIEDFSITEGTSELSLTVLAWKGRSYEEIAHDPFHMDGEIQTSPFQFQLEYLPDEQCYFILSPFDVVKAEKRDYDDHIDFLIERKRFTEAVEAFEKPPSATQMPRRHTKQSVFRAHANYLMATSQTAKAVELFPHVYKTSEEWKEQIQRFIEKNELDIIAPYIPTDKPRLEPSVYEEILKTYLTQKKYDQLKKLLARWPAELYNINSIDNLIRLQMNGDQTAQGLLECYAIMAEKQGNVMKTFDIYLKMHNVQIFLLIEQKKLYGEILAHLKTLMEIDTKTTLEMLLNHMDIIPVRAVYDILQKERRYLHAYLDAVFSRNPNDSRDYHTPQVSLYGEFEPEKLMNFLRKADNYNVLEAISICNEKKLHRAMVFLYGRAGNGRTALQIILEELKDIEEAIYFCRETGDQALWATLIDYSKDKPNFIDGLLNHAGSDINLQQLIENIRGDLRIPNLRDSLCKIMRDYNIQMSLSECCRKIIVHDCLALRKKTVTLLQSGYPVNDTDLCAKCHNPLYSPDVLNNPPISVFFCLHVFHAKCVETNPDICGVCSTSSLFTSV